MSRPHPRATGDVACLILCRIMNYFLSELAVVSISAGVDDAA